VPIDISAQVAVRACDLFQTEAVNDRFVGRDTIVTDDIDSIGRRDGPS
jgi:hypothetical protein